MEIKTVAWSWRERGDKLFAYFRAHLGNDVYMYSFYTPIGVLDVVIDFE